MRTFSVVFTAILLGALLAFVPTAGWTQSSAPPATPGSAPSTDQPAAGTPTPSPSGSATGSAGGSASGTMTAPSTAAPSAPAPSTTPPSKTAPDTTTPSSPGAATSSEGRIPGDQAGDGRIFGMNRTTAVVLGLVILGIIVALVAMSRRDREVVETRVNRDVRVYDRERDVLDDRDRPRKVS
jgi:hypothetical protein